MAPATPPVADAARPGPIQGRATGEPTPAGWWQASDGRWYPPESHPSLGSTSAAGGRKSRGALAVKIVAGIVGGLLALFLLSTLAVALLGKRAVRTSSETVAVDGSTKAAAAAYLKYANDANRKTPLEAQAENLITSGGTPAQISSVFPGLADETDANAARLRAIQFPPAAQPYATAILRDDAAIASELRVAAAGHSCAEWCTSYHRALPFYDDLSAQVRLLRLALNLPPPAAPSP